MIISARVTRRSAVAALIATFLLSTIAVLPASADSTPQTLPFSQNWSNTGLLTTTNVWSGVPGIIGSRGDDLTATTGADPQAVLSEQVVLDAIVNQTSTALTQGGVAEYEIADPVVALQGSGTADAPHIILTVNLTGQTNVDIAYNLRDIDDTSDNAIQPVALQYRIGTSGPYTNLPAGFVADATTGPSLATLVTPVSVTLPAAVDNQPTVNVRIITTNAVGSDEWVGIDDISVTGTPIVGDTAPAVASTIPANDATDVAVDADVSVTFSEPVDLSGAWNSISCATSGAHTGTVTGGPSTFTLNPDTDFTPSELCTVTIVAAQVTDQDTDDPPDNMTVDHVFSFTIAAPVVLPDLVINEIDYDQPSTDTAEFLEIKNVGDSAANLGAVSINFVNGVSGGAVSYRLTALPDVSLAAGDYFVVCGNAANTTECDLDITPDTDLIQNGAPDALALMVGSALIDTVSYEGSTPGFTEGSGVGLADTALAFESISRCLDGTDTDQNNVDFLLRSSTPGSSNACPGVDLAPTIASTTPANGAIGVGLASNISITFSEQVDVTGTWFTIGCATSGAHDATVSGGPTSFSLDPSADFAANESCTVTVLASSITDADTEDPPDDMAADYVFTFQTADVLVCGAPATSIHAVQGAGPISPLLGTGVTVEGIVVGAYQDTTTEFGGFYLQERTPDADTLTSEGIFVFDNGSGTSVQPGDIVRARGTVAEFFNLTEINAVSGVLVCSTGSPLPPATPVTLPVQKVTDLEAFEGMLVEFDQAMTATEVFNLGNFGEVSLSAAGRLYTGTAVADPGPAALAVIDLNNRSRIILDDGNSQADIDPIRYPQGGLSASNTLRVGDTLPGVTGIMDFRFSNYRIQPVGPITWTHANARIAAPEPVGGNLKVASFNVLNFFNGDGLGGGFPTARGADTQLELDRQKAKEISALKAINADIVGLMEIENDATPNSAIEELVAGLNAAMGAGTYAFIDTGIIGTDEIKVALIYKPGVVSPVGAYKIITTATDPRFVDTLNRPSLAQTFEDASGARLTVVVNHLKSKGSACPGDPDAGDGAGNCNMTRTNAAKALVDWLATDPTGSGDPDFLFIGDFNAYTFEDPIDWITTHGYTNLVREAGGLTPYSYVFNGESGYLDHALATGSLASQVTGIADWHINPDEPTVLDYNMEDKSANQINTLYDPGPYRSSDHDPVIIGLQLPVPPQPPTVDAGGPYDVFEGGSVTVSATGTEPGGGALTYSWDLDDDGTFETPGQSVTFSAADLEAPQTLTIAVEATGPTGLTATDEATVNVIWDFGGFLPPFEGATTKDVNAGQTVVIKFSLDGGQGLDIFREGYPASAEYPCGSPPPLDATEPARLATPTGFRYDRLRDEYVFEWKTDKDWQDTCRVFVLGLADGTTHNLAFHFR